MTKASADDWKTPLGYYERAIAELRRTREEIQADIQNFKNTHTSIDEIGKLKKEFESSQKEIQSLKTELEATKDNLDQTKKRADLEQKKLQNELQSLKEIMNNEIAGNPRIIQELIKIQEQLSQLQHIQPVEGNNFKTQILQSISNLSLQISKLEYELTLISQASGTDYSKLRELLKKGKWKEADRETHLLMCRISNRERDGWQWLDRGEIERFPWQDFRIINRLWIDYSNEKFGFSIQKQIWQNIKVDNNNDFEVERTFADRVGWRVNNSWIKSDELNFSLTAAQGHLPSTAHLFNIKHGRVEDRIRFLFNRRDFQT